MLVGGDCTLNVAGDSFRPAPVVTGGFGRRGCLSPYSPPRRLWRTLTGELVLPTSGEGDGRRGRAGWAWAILVAFYPRLYPACGYSADLDDQWWMTRMMTAEARLVGTYQFLRTVRIYTFVCLNGAAVVTHTPTAWQHDPTPHHTRFTATAPPPTTSLPAYTTPRSPPAGPLHKRLPRFI